METEKTTDERMQNVMKCVKSITISINGKAVNTLNKNDIRKEVRKHRPHI